MGDKLSENICNALTELGNIGAGNAATSLSKLLSSKLTMGSPKVALYDFNALENILGGAESTVVGVLAGIEGEMKAMILFVLGVNEAEQLVKSMLGEETQWQSELGMSVVTEIANIIVGSYVASLETLSGLRIRYSQPEPIIDMAGAILSVPCIVFGKVSDKALLINSQFSVDERKIDGYIMVISETHSYDVLLKQLGIGEIDE